MPREALLREGRERRHVDHRDVCPAAEGHPEEEGPQLTDAAGGAKSPADNLPRLVTLACHDLRTPLATVYGFARTLANSEGLDERTRHFVGLMEAAAEQMTELLDELGVVARIANGVWEPALREVDTRELAQGGDERVGVDGTGEIVRTAPDEVARALAAFAGAALRHGGLERVTWHVSGRALRLEPVPPEVAPVLAGEQMKDLGALVARRVLEALGGSVAIGDGELRIELAST